jgi:hypothetical protein
MPRSAFKITMKEAKTGFFRSRIILDAVEKGVFEANRQVGGRVRTTARRDMKLATPYRTKSALKGEALKSYEARRSIWRRLGSHPGKEPSLGFRPSRENTPPRYHHKGKKLNIRNAVVFVQVKNRFKSNSVVIGPTRFARTSGTPVPQLHEHGGVGPPRYRGQRPRKYPLRQFMRPALNKNKAKIKEIYARKIGKAFSRKRTRRAAA